MSSFLKKLSLFIAIVLVYCCCNYLINKFIIAKKKFKLNEKVWIMGESHIMTALNPEMIPGSIDLAQAAEPYTVTFLKLKQFLHYGKPDTVIIGFGCNDISEFNDKKLVDEQWSGEMIRRIYSFLSYNDIEQFDINPKTYLRVVFRKMLIYPHTDHFAYFGKFRKINHELDTLTSSLATTIKRHYSYKNKPAGISTLNLMYLDSIISLAEKNNITVILLNTPVTINYFRNIPEKFKVEFARSADMFRARGLSVLDYSQNSYPTNLFFNCDHLNYNGACRFTSELKQSLLQKK